jgi:plasmid stabilization system protein ParE
MTDMLRKVRFAEEASLEFRESVEWYELRAKGLGLRFTDEIDSTVERIRLNPDLYMKIAENIRRIQVNKFPYSVFYATEEDILVILRIFHSKRKPVEW